jgi:hypothetical protein
LRGVRIKKSLLIINGKWQIKIVGFYENNKVYERWIKTNYSSKKFSKSDMEKMFDLNPTADDEKSTLDAWIQSHSAITYAH